MCISSASCYRSKAYFKDLIFFRVINKNSSSIGLHKKLESVKKNKAVVTNLPVQGILMEKN